MNLGGFGWFALALVAFVVSAVLFALRHPIAADVSDSVGFALIALGLASRP